MRYTLALATALSLALLVGCPPVDPEPEPEPVACGGWLGNTCDAGEFCLFEVGAICGWADASGTCATPPTACYLIYAPVCGCDGATYSNDCQAHAAGTSVQHEGACECQDGWAYSVAFAEVVGEWTGTHTWPVEWEFFADGTFTKTDLISPCPQDVMCFWSGIVTNTGTWTTAGYEVELSYDSPSNMAGATTPAALQAVADCDSSKGFVLTEAHPGGATIVYSP